MKILCKLNIEYDELYKAENILRSIKVDDFDFVTSKVKNNAIEASIESKSVSSLIHTLDDYLSCLSVAEKIVDKN